MNMPTPGRVTLAASFSLAFCFLLPAIPLYAIAVFLLVNADAARNAPPSSAASLVSPAVRNPAAGAATPLEGRYPVDERARDEVKTTPDATATADKASTLEELKTGTFQCFATGKRMTGPEQMATYWTPDGVPLSFLSREAAARLTGPQRAALMERWLASQNVKISPETLAGWKAAISAD